jgi:hypothetical protein
MTKAMPRKANPSAPGQGNHSSRRYKGGPPRRTVVIDKNLARQLRHIAPAIKIDNLVHALLVQFLSSLDAPPPHSGEKE